MPPPVFPDPVATGRRSTTYAIVKFVLMQNPFGLAVPVAPVTTAFPESMINVGVSGEVGATLVKATTPKLLAAGNWLVVKNGLPLTIIMSRIAPKPAGLICVGGEL